MAALFCWKTGVLGVCPTKLLPEGVLVLRTGTEADCRRELLASGDHDQATDLWYVPGLKGAPDELDEDARFALVQDYIKLLAQRLRCRTEKGRKRWAAMENTHASR